MSNNSNKSIPLWVFLYMYEKAEHECYIEYMRGAKALYRWLASEDGIAFPIVSVENIKIPSSLQGYSSQELAKIILENSFSPEVINVELLCSIHDVITFSLITEVFPRLNVTKSGARKLFNTDMIQEIE